MIATVFWCDLHWLATCGRTQSRLVILASVVMAISAGSIFQTAYYFAFGHDERNPIAGRRVEVRSNMAAVEASVDKDYLRFKRLVLLGAGRRESD